MRRSPPIPTVAAIDSLRHPEVRAKRASKDGNMHRLATILRGPRKERGHLRVNAIAFIPGMTVIVWCRQAAVSYTHLTLPTNREV